MLYHRLFGRPAPLVAVGLALTLIGCTTPPPTTTSGVAVPHRALRAALYHLKEALEEVRDEKLQRHQERIERDIRTAIREIERALGEGKVDPHYEPHRGWDEQHKSFRHLRQALVELDEARDEVRREKGDWAQRRELKESIEDARGHVKEALEEIKESGK
jgi:hypothetical protein